jgi:signal transduction histidine kinase
LEVERRRGEALAEIDRAKTRFFANISHEFRTPLTLMLGPLEEMKRMSAGAVVPQPHYPQLDLVHRNGLRLLKLVNTLLDFSRIEAGRVQSLYEATNLAQLTAHLASEFRSAMEKAGLRLVVNAPPLAEPAYVDREMWEKIVLNLLSNAFKFTFEGTIEVSLRQENGHFQLAVTDTGTGIPADELPRLFERFHRVGGAKGRTHEGSGIGLALVQELTRLHGGSVTVESEYGKGSTFRVSIPSGTDHLPQQQIGGRRTQASTGRRQASNPKRESRRDQENGTVSNRGCLSEISFALAARAEPDPPRFFALNEVERGSRYYSVRRTHAALNRRDAIGDLPAFLPARNTAAHRRG